MHCSWFSCFSCLILNLCHSVYHQYDLYLSLPQRCTDIHKIFMSWRSSSNWMPEPGAQTAGICVMAVLWTLSHPVFLVCSSSLHICADCTEQHFLENCVCWCQPQHLFHVTTNIDFSVFVTKHWRYKPHWAGILIRCFICFLGNLVGNPALSKNLCNSPK